EEEEEEDPPNTDLANFFDGCSLHGANHIFVENKKFGVRQGLWAVSFLAALTLFLIQVGDRIAYYAQYDHVTMLDEREAPNMTFPAITMCNFNTFRRSQMSYSDLLFMGPLIGYEDNMAPGFQLAPEPDRQGARFSMAEFFNRTRHRMEDMLLECKFAGADCGPEHWREQTRHFQRGTLARVTRQKPAGGCRRGGGSGRPGGRGHAVPRARFQSLFASAARGAALHEAAAGPTRASARGNAAMLHADALFSFHSLQIFTRYGKCYTFNSGQDGQPLRITTKGGMGNGLELMLDIQQDEYLPVWGETGPCMLVCNIKWFQYLFLQFFLSFLPFFLQLTYLPSPWGDCRSEPIDSDFFTTYSITACRIDCETRYLVENCNCRMVHMPAMRAVMACGNLLYLGCTCCSRSLSLSLWLAFAAGDAPYCTPEQYKECADPALDFLVERDNDYCVCDTPCNMTRYGKELSFVKIPSKASAKYLAKKYNKTEQYISDNILVLDIFFEALNYETIEQKKAYELPGLLGKLFFLLRLILWIASDIGGQMGLFIGASILTILELFDYLYEV
ncbi:acid-sensing ion channel 1B, partial [Silurus asotus]